jgi:hypothetical protein
MKPTPSRHFPLSTFHPGRASSSGPPGRGGLPRATLRLLSAVCLLLLAACQLNPASTQPPPTLTPQFTATLATLTVTPSPALPTGTPTPEVTSTPAAASTPDPNLGVGAVLYDDPFDDASRWNWLREGEDAMFSVAGGQLNAVMTLGNVGPRFSAWEHLNIGDQKLRVTARANLCYAHDEYGVMFRLIRDSLNHYHGYIFKLNCSGQARVELLENVQSTPLVDWTASPAIVPGAPAENALMVWAAKDQFHFYVNDKYLFSLNDKTYAEGFYGFYIRDRTNGGESVSFDDLVAREVNLP